LTGLYVVPGPQELTLSWDAVPDATSYDVTWSSAGGPSGAVSVSDPYAVIQGLVPDVTYTVSVVARNGGGTGPPATTTGVPDPVPPAPAPAPVALPTAPTGLRVTAARHRLRVTWQAAGPGTSYDIELVGETAGYLGRRTDDDGVADYRGLIAGERYTVSLTPTNSAGAGPTVQAAGTPTGPRVAGPAKVRARVLGGGRVRVVWQPRPRATSYEVAARRRGPWIVARTTTTAKVALSPGPGPIRLKVRSWHDRVPGRWSTVVQARLR
jgi:hypothetical protein